MKNETEPLSAGFFERLAQRVSKFTGSTPAVILAIVFIFVWGLTGPLFHYSVIWETVLSTVTTIITFLMVFVIQKAQNKDSLAIQLKLDELIAANEFASNRLVNVEEITEEEMKVIKKYYLHLSKLTKKEENPLQSHSIAETNNLAEPVNEK